MSKRDVLDQRMAQRFAWRAAMSGELPEMAEPGASPAPTAAPAAKPPDAQAVKASQERREHITRACADLARQVALAWEMTPQSHQVAATTKLLERVLRLGLEVIGMREHPKETVRLYRLVVRHYQEMPAHSRKESVHALCFAPVPTRKREVTDLLVEVAEVGEPWLTFLIERSEVLEAAGRRHPELGARLARVLDEGTTWAPREIAARWLAIGGFPSAVPSLQRALRLPHARIRWAALYGLFEMKPRALTESDVLWLLADALSHPLPGGSNANIFDMIPGYEDTLIEAVGALHPAEGWRPLAILADGGGALIRRERAGLSTSFALRALAAGYPKRALARIDRSLADSQWSGRLAAVLAAGLLPEELARPRLLDAAAGPDHTTAERAKVLWFERFGAECPTAPLAGVPAELLLEPPSEAFFARLSVLRGSSTEAAGALLAVLLAEAPSAPAPAERESLALLLFSLRLFSNTHRRPGLPSGEEAWAARLIERFGEPAKDGLFTLAERGALAGSDQGWIRPLTSLAQSGVIAGADRDRLRDLAARALQAPGWSDATGPLVALVAVGAPPELCDRLWSIAMRPPADDVPEGNFAFARHWAVDALCAMKDAPALDERIALSAEDALRDRAYEELEQRVTLGCRRRLPAVFEIVERCLAGLDEDPALFDVASSGTYWMKEAGRIDEDWAVDALGRPEERRFEIAASLCYAWPSPAVVDALSRALASPDRAGSAAAEAASALVVMKSLGALDPRLDGILERAPLQPRASLLDVLLLRAAPLAPFRRHAVDLLVSADAKAAEDVFEALFSNKPEGTMELFEAVLELEPLPSIREAIKEYLGKPSEMELYWQDAGDEDEEEGDE
jgi:hypothetical protein